MNTPLLGLNTSGLQRYRIIVGGNAPIIIYFSQPLHITKEQTRMTEKCKEIEKWAPVY